MGLDWEEGLFSLFLRIGRRFRAAPQDLPGLIRWQDEQRRLTLLAQMISGIPVQLRSSEGIGGIAGDTILLPESLSVYDNVEANGRCYLLRVLLSAIIIRDELDRQANDEAWEVAEARIQLELPGTIPLLVDELADHQRLEPGAPYWHRGQIQVITGIIGGSQTGEVPTAISGTECDAPIRDQVRVVELDDKDAEKSVLKAAVEQVETIDRWRGGSRDADASDDLSEHKDAMDECDIREVIRGGAPPESLYRSDIMLDADIGESDKDSTAGIPYDEWDYRQRQYKTGWCTVVPQRWSVMEPAWVVAADRRLLPVIRRAQAAVAHAREQLRARPRELDGESIDLEAWTRECADRVHGGGGEQRLYARLARRRREWATTVLIDVSFSADSGIDGRRVLDVARDVVHVLGRTGEAFGDNINVLAFASQTRNRCWVWSLSRKGQSWAVVAAGLGGLAPRGYTRIGPALRHATALLKREVAERRLLFLIGDGRPTDHDRYEGRYGIADVRRAVEEASAAGIHVHACAIDGTARAHLPAQFGPGCWRILPNVDRVPEALADMYGQLTAL